MWDIVIPYKATSSNELQYALKSLKNIDTETGRVFILDKRLNPNVYLDQIYKYESVLEDVSPTFIATNDDIFVMKPWKPTIYNKGSLDAHIAARKGYDIYTKSLLATRNWLVERGLETLSYEMHTPFVYDRDKLIDLLAIIPTQPLQLRSLYGNYYQIESVYMEDVKNPKDYKDKVILSTNNTTFKSELGAYIRANL